VYYADSKELVMKRDITELLGRWRNGDGFALEELFTLLEARLKSIARGQLRHDRPNHTLQPTALLNEFYMKLLASQRLELKDREHFFNFAAYSMRRILIEYARRQNRQRRGGGQKRVSIESLDSLARALKDPVALIFLENALSALEQQHPEAVRVIEHKFFLGMDWEEAASATGLSVGQARRFWDLGRAFLRARLGDEGGTDQIYGDTEPGEQN
jgi:RNA polymerase sigma factor (TIGR02999 family)